MAEGDRSGGGLSEGFQEWTFLIVDDNPASLSMLRSMLLMLDLTQPLEALDGAMAMEIVRRNHLDCIITDVRMAPMGGAEFVRWVRRSNEAANPAARILAMSAYRDPREVEALAAEGANGFLAKPLSVPLLRRALEAAAQDGQDFVEIVSSADPYRPSVRRLKGSELK